MELAESRSQLPVWMHPLKTLTRLRVVFEDVVRTRDMWFLVASSVWAIEALSTFWTSDITEERNPSWAIVTEADEQLEIAKTHTIVPMQALIRAAIRMLMTSPSK
ncbi:hypothetical protein HDF13_000174 [Edaphobacter lichenicola]|uniref:Uncharacterized protein n=1 Tax=Tunturiibacter gelidiferens TaxID=3069689 RepID=A0ACC5NTR0_9BACT|nr:hypothetical protein [Edaphobacter lichenicola]